MPRTNKQGSVTINTFLNVLNKQKTEKIMFLDILSSHKDDFLFLQDQPTQILADFCKLAWSFLKKGTNMKLYQSASQKLQADVKQIQSGVEGLAYLFIEARKNELKEEGFKEAVLALGLPEDLFSTIYEEYLSQNSILDSVLPEVGIQHAKYKDLEWRFETQVSSKSMKNQIQPRVIMKLELEKGGQTERICLQSDIPNVIHISQLISQAVQESTTQHSKRILRAVT